VSVDPSLIELMVERRIAAAMAAGELEQGDTFKGRPLPDLDTPRQPGWWAASFVARERARLAAEDAAGEG
jgi:hypothetical protein